MSSSTPTRGPDEPGAGELHGELRARPATSRTPPSSPCPPSGSDLLPDLRGAGASGDPRRDGLRHGGLRHGAAGPGPAPRHPRDVRAGGVRAPVQTVQVGAGEAGVPADAAAVIVNATVTRRHQPRQPAGLPGRATPSRTRRSSTTRRAGTRRTRRSCRCRRRGSCRSSPTRAVRPRTSILDVAGYVTAGGAYRGADADAACSTPAPGPGTSARLAGPLPGEQGVHRRRCPARWCRRGRRRWS